MKVSIIGVGLIGGSIGLALKKLKTKGTNLKVTGIGRNIERLGVARKLKAVDEITTDIKKGVKDADIIFICLPVGRIAGTVQVVSPFCKKNTIITDVGSVKELIVAEAEKFVTPSVSFVGGHPIAGREKASVKFASAGLFQDAVVVLTPTKKTNKKSLQVIKNLWQKMGAGVEVMSPAEHDKIISRTSHLPHAVAFALVNSVDNTRFAGNGFKDTTRIASSDPKMWADIFFNNLCNIKKAIKEFKKELSKIENAGTTTGLARIFKKAKTKRDKLCR